VRYGGKILFIDGPSNARVWDEVENEFKAQYGWTLPKNFLLQLSGSPYLLSTDATFDEVIRNPFQC
jgi:hypothetical protein